MSDYPDTITMSNCKPGDLYISNRGMREYKGRANSKGDVVMYRQPRADLPPTHEQLMADPRVVALVDAIQDALDANQTELNLGNYSHDDVCNLQNEAIGVWQILTAALAQFKGQKP